MSWRNTITNTPAEQKSGWRSTVQPLVGTNTEVQDPEYQAIRKETDRGLIQEFKDSSKVVPQTITKEEIDTIARKHGVSSEGLYKVAPYFGAFREGDTLDTETVGKTAAGQAGLVAFGLPQKLYKMAQSDAEEKALDDLQELARARNSLLLSAAQSLALPGVAVGKAAGVGAKVAAGAGTGAVAGFGGSREGNEVVGTAVGAVIGGAIGAIPGAIEATPKAYQSLRKLVAPESEDAVRNTLAKVDVTRVYQDIIPKAEQAHNVIFRRIQGDKTPLNQQEAKEVLDNLIDNETLAKYLDPKTAEGQRVLKEIPEERIASVGLEKALEEHVLRTLPEQIVDGKVRELAQDIIKRPLLQEEDAYKILQGWSIKRDSTGESLNRRMQDKLEQDHLLDYINKTGAVTDDATLARRGTRFFMDAQYTLRDIDNKIAGIDIEPVHQELGKRFNQMTFPKAALQKELQEIHKLNMKDNLDDLIDPKVGEDLIARIERSGLAELSDREAKFYSRFQPLFEKARNMLNTRDGKIPGLTIQKRDNYIPAVWKEPRELQKVMGERVDSLLSDLSQVSGKRYRDIADVPESILTNFIENNTPAQETVRIIQLLSNTESKNPADLSRAYKQTFLSREGRIALEPVARATLERTNAIPLWARETNLYKLADGWISNTLRQKYLAEPLASLNRKADSLSQLGAEAEAGYVRNLVQDVQGIRKNTYGELANATAIKFLGLLERMENRVQSPAKKEAIRALRGLPQLGDFLNKAVYANYLGASARAITMNSTQTIAKTIPEFGLKYGSSLALRAVTSMAGNGWTRTQQRLQRLGLVPEKFVASGRGYLGEGKIARSEAMRKATVAQNTISEVTMSLYQKMEELNRGIALNMADMMSHDLLTKQSKLAQEALERFPKSVQRRVQKAVAAQDQELLSDILATHIVNSTQYQYNKANASEFSRTFGPYFATFSKWPTATLGDIVTEWESSPTKKASKRIMAKYVAPFALLQVVDGAMGEKFWDKDDKKQGIPETIKVATGKSGLSGSSPIGTLYPLLTGDFFTPPMVDNITKSLIVPAVDGDAPSLYKGAGNLLYSYAPGGLGGITRFITDDIVRAATNKPLKAKDFLGKTEEGLEKLTK